MQINLHHVVDIIAYWVVFWTIANALLPPREIFKEASPKFQARYNIFLMLVAFYGAINVRQLTVKLYSAVGQAMPDSAPHALDNALVDAAANTQKAAEAIDKAKDAAPKDDK